MHTSPPHETATTLDPRAAAFYRRVLQTLQAAGLPALVGGAYAFAIYTGIERHTKDLDVFVRRADYDRVAQVLAAAGYATQLTFPHWLGKAYAGPLFVDLIFDSSNGLTPVDQEWFENAVDAQLLGIPARILGVGEMIWSKLFVMERERYDGADVAHLLRVGANTLDWPKLLHRVGSQWRVLLSHIVLFGFIYPGERAQIPTWVVDQLLDRLRDETQAPPPGVRLCRGTLLSREQYLHDVAQDGYADARLPPFGTMSAHDVAAWTAASQQDNNE